MEGVLYGTIMQAYLNGEDGDEQECGRILPLGLFIEKIKTRKDIFFIDRDSRLSKMEIACVALAVATGILVGSAEIRKPIESVPLTTHEPHVGSVSLSPSTIEVGNHHYSRTISKLHQIRHSIRPSVKPHYFHSAGGVGSPNAAIARATAFRVFNQRIRGVSAQGIDGGASLAGVAGGIDAVINGLTELKSGGAESGRRMEPGIGTQAGFGPSGFYGGNGGDMGDPLAGLMEPDGTPLAMRPVRHSTTLDKIGAQTYTLGSALLVGGRSKSSIMHTVLENLPALRYAYNRWLRMHPGAAGKITVKFAIDEFGNVIFCDVANATLQDPNLSRQVVSIVKKWNFGKIDKPGDITEAIYPLVFSM